MPNQNLSDAQKTFRCAIYTRKSHEEGLEQEYNSLDAQRDAGEAYIASQRLQGWQASPERYDDGGFSGSTTDRPALKRLLADIDSGKIDIIVVYKIDRLSRSLLDFVQMIEKFNQKNVSFVSVTQQISTTDSTGRMMLNILMTFAQYEREVIADRIRDKVAAAKRKGKYCGGVPVLGYDVDHENRRLLINDKEAKVVRHIFRRFFQLGSVRELAAELNEQGYRTKAWSTVKGKARKGSPWNKSHIYRLLNNRLYLGEISHRGRHFKGEHEQIIERSLWDNVQQTFQDNKRTKADLTRTKMVASLKGVIRCGHCQGAMGPTYTKKGGRRYTYYRCETNAKRAVGSCPITRIPAADVEKVVLEQLSAFFRTPTCITKTYAAALQEQDLERERLNEVKQQIEEALAQTRAKALELSDPQCTQRNQPQLLADVSRRAAEQVQQLAQTKASLEALNGTALTEAEIAAALHNIHQAWENLFPAERNRIIRLLLEKVEVYESEINMVLRSDGLTTLITELV